MKHHFNFLTSETFINMYLFAKRKTNYRETFPEILLRPIQKH